VQFGLRLAPELAHRFTMFIKRVLHATGLNAVVGVMDDYLLVHVDREACLVMLVVASALLADLGFSVNFKPGKTVLPARVQKFVGVVINSARFTLSLPPEKLQVLLEGVGVALQRRTIGRKPLQRLVGRMQWAAKGGVWWPGVYALAAGWSVHCGAPRSSRYAVRAYAGRSALVA
jgi:hypothetical protein